MHHLLQTWHHFLHLWSDWVLTAQPLSLYLGIVLLMAMESSIFPVPSEMVIPPAAFLAAQGKLSFAGVVLAGTVGSYLGAAITYWISRIIGRAVILRFGKFVLLSREKLEKAENWLARYETGGVFFARLLPVVRHIISIPAGIVRMNFAVFSLVTVAGSALWCLVLAYLGRRAYQLEPQLLSDPEKMVSFIKGQSHLIAIAVVAFAGLYLLAVRLMKPASK